MKLQPFAIVAILICSGAIAQDDGTKEELAKLEGTYNLVRGEEGGKPMSEQVLKNSKLTITGNKHVVKLGDEVPIVGTHTVNPLEKPKSIDASDTAGRFAGKTSKGIYKLDGDEFTVSFSPPGEARPQEFNTQNRPGRMLHVWKKTK